MEDGPLRDALIQLNNAQFELFYEKAIAKKMRDALFIIANEDYRGPRPSSAVLAEKVLQEVEDDKARIPRK